MTETKEDLISYRDLSPTDIGFVISTWLTGLYYGNPWFKQIDQETYFNIYNKIVKSIIFKPNIKIRIACLTEDPEVILGYSVFEERDNKRILHWIFTKEVWRNIGIAKKLLPKEISHTTHLTKVGKSLKPKKWKFNPFLI